jgi:hypothetical protein
LSNEFNGKCGKHYQQYPLTEEQKQSLFAEFAGQLRLEGQDARHNRTTLPPEILQEMELTPPVISNTTSKNIREKFPILMQETGQNPKSSIRDSAMTL